MRLLYSCTVRARFVLKSLFIILASRTKFKTCIRIFLECTRMCGCAHTYCTRLPSWSMRTMLVASSYRRHSNACDSSA
ncbi:hypothetical protein HMPREF3190_00549 [Umbribacter vaginalis]|nr:hypothetical protein HMPREF3190_00549 [Coriobacteriales bacterium DNF00809]